MNEWSYMIIKKLILIENNLIIFVQESCANSDYLWIFKLVQRCTNFTYTFKIDSQIVSFKTEHIWKKMQQAVQQD